jgi:hypothetical protein
VINWFLGVYEQEKEMEVILTNCEMERSEVELATMLCEVEHYI